MRDPLTGVTDCADNSKWTIVQWYIFVGAMLPTLSGICAFGLTLTSFSASASVATMVMAVVGYFMMFTGLALMFTLSPVPVVKIGGVVLFLSYGFVGFGLETRSKYWNRIGCAVALGGFALALLGNVFHKVKINRHAQALPTASPQCLSSLYLN
jgi:hypothetical protein